MSDLGLASFISIIVTTVFRKEVFALDTEYRSPRSYTLVAALEVLANF